MDGKSLSAVSTKKLEHGNTVRGDSVMDDVLIMVVMCFFVCLFLAKGMDL